LILVKKILKEDWIEKFAENAHLTVFDERIEKDKDAIDFALITIDQDTDRLVSYVTVREYDKDHAHWFWGGSFPTYRGTVSALRSMEAIFDWIKANYKKLSFFTQNTNFPMLKFGIQKKFQIVGLRLAQGGLLLEHVIEFNKEEK
jgi:RimJ/RimL family protein N-acetyltransferase